MIAAKLPGRTDNEIKNYWHTHIKKDEKDQIYPTSSGQGELKDHHEQSAGDDHGHSSFPSEASTSQVNNVSEHHILDSSPLSTAVLNNSYPSSTNTSTTEYSSSSSSSSYSLSSPNDAAPVSTVSMNCLADKDTDLASSSETMILDLDFSTGDFWTEPYLRDDMYIQSNVTSSSSSSSSSPFSSYISFYDDGTDLFYQVMPTLEESTS